MVTVGVVLLIACANVANLMMAGATGRRKEMAVRLAIGAGRGRLVRQLLVETLILFGAGAAGGLLVAHWGIVWIDQAIPLRSRPYLPNFGHVDVDEQMLLFALAVALATGLVFGLAPALESTRFDLNSMLKDSAGRGTGSLSGARFRKGLVAGEVALTLVVVVCGALLINSFTRMMRVDPGFRGLNRRAASSTGLPATSVHPEAGARIHAARRPPAGSTHAFLHQPAGDVHN